MKNTLAIETFTLGQWQTNCYVLHARGPVCWIIDAGFWPGEMVRYIKENDLQPAHVLLTHAHVDHIGGLHALRVAFPDIPILIHAAERDFLTEPALNLSIALDDAVTAPPATGALEHGQTLHLDDLIFEVRHTPGHSPGGVTFYQPDVGVALVGDTLFAGSIGRTDFPTSDHEALVHSIAGQLLSLPDATRVLPGHGPATTIGRERTHNPFIAR